MTFRRLLSAGDDGADVVAAEAARVGDDVLDGGEGGDLNSVASWLKFRPEQIKKWAYRNYESLGHSSEFSLKKIKLANITITC
jgi:hypothetical protein